MPTTYEEAFAVERLDTQEHLDSRVVNKIVAELDAIDAQSTFADTLHDRHQAAQAFWSAPTPLYHAVAHQVGMDWSSDETRERDQRIQAELRDLVACDHDEQLAEQLRGMADEIAEVA